MKVSTDKLSKQIALEVAKLLLPRVKKIVKEEVQSALKDIIYESVINKNKKLRSLYEENELEDSVEKPTIKRDNIDEAKKIVAKRQAIQSARQKGSELAKKIFGNDLMAEMIMTADDKETDLNNRIVERENKLANTPVRDIREVSAIEVATGEVDPSTIDFSAYLNDEK